MNNKNSKSLTYKDSGVDITAGDDLVQKIKPLAKKTLRDGVINGIGGFGALFEISKKYQEPVLVSGTDGVGTKLKLAFALNKHDTVGQDLVAMSVNDILVQGAESLFFLDYFACGKLNVNVAADVVAGIAKGCELAGCALIGGETAEMPDMYPDGEYDLAGFAVGVVEKSKIINGKNIKNGDVILGLASSGVHSNGYSLVRKIVEISGVDLKSAEKFDGEKTLAQAILEPTKIYVKPVLTAINADVKIKGIAHITGGGLSENIPRILPENVIAELQYKNWVRPKIFDWLQQNGNIADAEMARTFNCGIGLILVVAAEEVAKLTQILQDHGEKVFQIGEIKARQNDEHQVKIIY